MKEKIIATNIQAYKISDTDCENLCLKAKAYGIGKILVGPSSLPLVFRMLEGSGVEVCASIAYPSGAFFAEAKAGEITELEQLYPQLSAYYAVMAVGRFLSGYEAEARAEMEAVKKAAGQKAVYIVTEAKLLSGEQMQKLCGMAADAGIEGIVDTTGFAPYDIPFPAAEDTARLVKAANGSVKVICNSSIDTPEKAAAALEAGADRRRRYRRKHRRVYKQLTSAQHIAAAFFRSCQSGRQSKIKLGRRRLIKWASM